MKSKLVNLGFAASAQHDHCSDRLFSDVETGSEEGLEEAEELCMRHACKEIKVDSYGI